MVAGGGSCLSDLPDDLLRRILFFAPAKEAASTSVLSSRWRWLWRASGAVNLDSRSLTRAASAPPLPRPPCGPDYYNFRTDDDDDHGRRERDGFLRGAGEAFAAATVPITRLTISVSKGCSSSSSSSSTARDEALLDGVPPPEHGLIAAVVSNPMARRVEDLSIDVEELSVDVEEQCKLHLGSLPSEALRELRVTNCATLPPTGATAAAFPRLADLHLHKCTVAIVDLQRIADAAPQLATMHLESCFFSISKEEDLHYNKPLRLACPAITALVVADCRFDWRLEQFSLELDLPRLQYFKHKGLVQHTNQLSLKSPNTIHQADLHLIKDLYSAGEGQVGMSFWKFIQNFRAAKRLKLRLDFISLDELFPCIPSSVLFHSLKRLELDAQCSPTKNEAMVVLACLLHSCPVVRELRLKLSKDIMSRAANRYSIDNVAQADFDKSVDRFRRRRIPMCSMGGDIYEASDIPVLSEQSFSCLQSYLRRVSLQFCMDKPNCLGVQLAKFFAENGVVLEEMFIDDGSQKMC